MAQAASPPIKIEAVLKLTQDLMQHSSDCRPYEGPEMTSWTVMTLLRGAIIADEGQILGTLGQCQFLARDRAGA
jgi:dihydropyrimidinase